MPGTDPFASPKFRDPVPVFLFMVELKSGIAVGNFQQVSGLGQTQDVIEHKASTATGKAVVQKIPGYVNYSDIVLKRGLTEDKSAWEGRQKSVDGKVNDARTDGSVVAYNQAHEESARWNFKNAWPTKIATTAVKADGKEVVMEEVTLAVEGLERAT